MNAERRWNGWGDEAVNEPLKPADRAFLAEAIGTARRRGTRFRRCPGAGRSAAFPPARASARRHPRAEARLRASFSQAARLAAAALRRARPRDRWRGVSGACGGGPGAARVGPRTRRAGAAVRRRDQRGRAPDAGRRGAGADLEPDSDDAALDATRTQLGALRGRRRRPRSRGAAARPRLHAGPLSAELRAVDPRRLGRDALVGPAVGALRPHRAAVRRRHAADARARMARCPAFPASSRRPRPARMGARQRRAPRRAHRGHGAHPRAPAARALPRRVLPRLGERPRGGARAGAGAAGPVDAAAGEPRRDVDDAGDGRRPRRRDRPGSRASRWRGAARAQVPAVGRLHRQRGARSRAMRAACRARLASRTAASRPAHCSARSGRRAASPASTCATACGTPATPSTRWRPRATGRGSTRWSPRSKAPAAPRSPPRASGSMPTPTCRTSMRRARASTRPSSTASAPTTRTLGALAAAQARGGRGDRRRGGTISHQHGVGTTTRRYLAAEKGELGMAALRGDGRRTSTRTA